MGLMKFSTTSFPMQNSYKHEVPGSGLALTILTCHRSNICVFKSRQAGVARRQVLSLLVQRNEPKKARPTLQAFGFPLASGQKPVGTGTRLRLKQPPRLIGF